MYSAQMKYLDGTKWKYVNLKELVGQSIVNFMSSTDKVMIAALSKEGTPQLFVSNCPDQVAIYAKKGLSLHVDDLNLLIGGNVYPSIVFDVFPDASFVAVKQLEKGPEKDTKQWW